MGNCQCSYCPGTTLPPTLPNLTNGFTEEVQVLIDWMREQNKGQLKNMKEYNLQNGKLFRGSLIKGKKSGYGQYFQNSNSYFGRFENDVPEGEGLLVRNYKDFIKGFFVGGKPNGQVKQKIGGREFCGHYYDGKKSKGVLKTDLYIYEGSFKENRFHGYGILEFKNGDRYEGDFQMGLYNGDGKYETADQGSYSGQFKNGLYEGKGVFKWRENYFYEGEYRKGVRNGLGKFFSGLALHEGFWVEGQPQSNSKFLEAGRMESEKSGPKLGA